MQEPKSQAPQVGKPFQDDGATWSRTANSLASRAH
jgi:hypothetical protein